MRKSVIVFAALCRIATAQDSLTYQMPQVVVESSKFSLTPLAMNRSTTIIDSASLQSAAPQSFGETLQLFSTTELRRRGTMDIQTDIGIRGSTFSQQAILLNGIRINDPQTAHHNFDLPVPMSAVKQIEIVRGPSSSHFGPDAFGGIINIVTAGETPSASIELSGGQFGYVEGAGTYGFTADALHSSTSLRYEKSDGFQYDTEFKHFTASTSNSLLLPDAALHLLLGYTNKDFGAFDFYSPPGVYAPSHEKTETIFSGAGAEFTFGGWDMSSHITFRHHFDDFIYLITNPSYSHNRHNTNIFDADFSGIGRISTEIFLSSSVEASTDNINSTKLGIHSRYFAAVSEIARWTPVESFSFDGGVRFDYHSDYDNQIHPIISAGYFIDERNKIYASCGTSYRIPSYTDLYYSDPTTVGNPDLKPEKGTSVETGIQSYAGSSLQFQLSGFYRHQNNLIDFVQYTSGGKFFAVNFSQLNVDGIEYQTSWNNTGSAVQWFHRIFLGYTFIESRLDTKGALSTRYSLTHPKHQLNGAVMLNLPFDIQSTFGGTYAHHSNVKALSTFDLTLTRQIDTFEVIVKATNIFNEPYQEIPGIPLPGRWIIGKIRWNIF